MEEKLLDSKLNEKEKRLLYQLDIFDLEDFYHNDGYSSGAVCLITKSQMIICDNYIRKDNNPTYDEHYDTVNEIYKIIYNKEISYSKVDENEHFICWQDFVVDDGNILIQLCSDISSPLWLPDSINEKQLGFLEEFNKRIKIIVSKDINYFDCCPIVFTQGEFEEEITYTNSLDQLIAKLKNNKRR